MPRRFLISSLLLASMLALSACGDDEAANVDEGGPIQAEEDGPVDLRDTADQLSRDAQDAAQRVQDQAREALQDAGDEAQGLWQGLQESADEAADALGEAANDAVDAVDDALGGGVLRDPSEGEVIGEDAPARPADDLNSRRTGQP
ncbi:hypothetical protein [Limoniibacter endophyticus]|uniref:Uncharacterized protein n=1 Tax=Limoniibacter endophyticus TaxID=1565040 RepID=A0A8J3GI63_9HYPH|nr:hypothetical protein [Limoniibacter endophyticus]GHC75128.1 hypothetical protein GCM10010136_24610 [Limoniibacter endophyticus]